MGVDGTPAKNQREAATTLTRLRFETHPVATDTISWFGGDVVMEVDTYVGPVAVPDGLVTSHSAWFGAGVDSC